MWSLSGKLVIRLAVQAGASVVTASILKSVLIYLLKTKMKEQKDHHENIKIYLNLQAGEDAAGSAQPCRPL